MLPDVGRMEQRFGGNAAHQQAGAAEFRLLFDQGCFQSVLAGADGCGVAAGTTPDDNQIVRHFFYSTCVTGRNRRCVIHEKTMKRLLICLMLAPACGFAQAGREGRRCSQEGRAAGPLSLADREHRDRRQSQFHPRAGAGRAGLKVGQVAGKAEFDAARDRLVGMRRLRNRQLPVHPGPNGGYAPSSSSPRSSRSIPVEFEDLHVSAARTEMRC